MPLTSLRLNYGKEGSENGFLKVPILKFLPLFSTE
jgi:hypothetical protein